LTWIVLMVGLMAAASYVAAETDWTDSVTDPAGDVEDTSGTIVDAPGADILFVSITEDGDDINVSMMLVGEYSPDGMYTVYVEVDGGDSWSFTRMSFVGFMVTDADGNLVQADGYYSADGKTLSWVVAKLEILASDRLEIEFASCTIVSFSGGATVTDYAGLGGSSSGSMTPDSMDWLMHFPELNILQMKVSMTYSGENAEGFRSLMDEDQDGTVTQAEVDTFLEDMEGDEDPEDPADANVTLDGKDPTDLESVYSFDGAKGAVDSTSDLKISIKMTLTFPKVEDKDTHEVEFEEPFGDEFIDAGDLPDGTTITFRFRAPDGWVFKTGSFPSTMKDYLNDDGDEVTMNTDDIEKDWNNTFGNLQKFSIEEGGSTPGFGLVVLVATATIAALAVRRRQ